MNSAQAFFNSNSDQKYLEDFRRRYEQLFYQLDNRQQLSRNFEKVTFTIFYTYLKILKFSKDLESSFDTLSTLLDSNCETVLNDEIKTHICNIFQIVKATLQQKAHQSQFLKKINV